MPHKCANFEQSWRRPGSNYWTNCGTAVTAERHRVHIIKRDRTRVAHEVYLFAELDTCGRVVRIEETTLMLEGAEADRDLGSAK